MEETPAEATTETETELDERAAEDTDEGASSDAESDESDSEMEKFLHPEIPRLEWLRHVVWKLTKRPVLIRQYRQMECGAACLTAISRYYGARCYIFDFKTILNIGREGATLLDIARAAEFVGFEVLGLAIEYDDLRRVRGPCIGTYDYHVIVIYRTTPTSVLVADPRVGMRWLGKDDFCSRWTGSVIALKPTKKLRNLKDSEYPPKKYLKTLSDSREEGFLVVSSVALSFLFGLVPAMFLQLIIDSVIGSSKPTLLTMLGVGTLLAATLSAGCQWSANTSARRAIHRQYAKVSSLLATHLFGMPVSSFKTRTIPDITNPFSALGTFRRTFVNVGTDTTSAAISMCLYLSVLRIYSGFLTTVVTIALLVFGAILWSLSKYLAGQMMAGEESAQEMQAAVTEHTTCLDTLRAIDGVLAARWRWSEKWTDAMERYGRSGFASSLVSGLGELIQGLINFGSLLISIRLYFWRELTLGQVLAVNSIVGSILQPYRNIFDNWNALVSTAVPLGRMEDLFTEPQEQLIRPGRSRSVDKEAPELSGAVEFVDVHFKYAGLNSRAILKGVSLKIEAGQKVAFVGPSGSGKTTLGYLVNLLYRPTGGQILLDGRDVTELPLEWVRRQIAMVFQESDLFSCSVLENIAFGDRDPRLELAVESAALSTAHAFISKLPNGYSTMLGTNGSGLSGGQAQKINIARALYRQPRILVMDEATSAMDSISEGDIIKNLSDPRVSRGRPQTQIIIAHRLNTIAHADRIFVLHGGHVVEEGKHSELLARKGLYFKLVETQIALGS